MNTTGTKYFLERPRARAQLIRILAAGYATTTAARVMKCTPGAISQFKARHKREIEQMQQGITNATDHLWISHQANRLAALDQGYQDLQDFKLNRISQQVDLTQSPAISPMTHGYETVEIKYYGKNKVELRKFDAALYNAELKTLREAAEALGQIPREPITVNPTFLQNNDNRTVNIFDRASVLALASTLRNQNDQDVDH